MLCRLLSASAPAHYLSVEIEAASRSATLVLAPMLAWDHPHDLELVSVGIVTVNRLGSAVVARAADRTVPLKRVACLAQRLDFVDLPGQVVEADAALVRRRRIHTDACEPEIVMILRTRRAHERHRVTHACNRLESEHVCVKREAAIEIAHPQHRVAEPANLHIS